MNTSASRLSKMQATGLDATTVAQKRLEFGYNELPHKRSSAFMQFVSQFHNILIYILLGAVTISLLVPFIAEGHVNQSELTNAIVILAIVILNACLGFFQERRAEHSIALLQKLTAPQAKVRRDGKTQMIASRELLPGDVLIIEAGDKIGADGDILSMSSFAVDESSLTGESMPSHKDLHGKDDSQKKIFAATTVVRGSAEAVVRSIGLQTEIGKLTKLVMDTKPPKTPLQVKLSSLSGKIGLIVLVICMLLIGVGYIRGISLFNLLFTAISLAVAAVPEGLPAIVTICLALGVQRMLSKHALVRRLDAIETLGNVTIICADKTGTMTENQMRVTDLWTVEEHDNNMLLTIAAACNRAELPDIGDPTEIALLVAAEENRVERLPIHFEDVPFTSEEKYMATSHVKEDGHIKFFKGAPEVIMSMTSHKEMQAINVIHEEYAQQGKRVLACAVQYPGTDTLSFVGLIAMMDPPRKGVKEAIATAKRAGIRTVMITGDNRLTALSIAGMIGIETSGAIEGKDMLNMNKDELREQLKTVSVFARVLPTQKVDILEALQADGHIVAMSGDGVNDAPALKRAHVGIAMGKRGTDIARESSAMVLTDDNFATIVEAVAEGRKIYDNIRKFITFLLRTNIGEVFIISFALVFGLPLPLLPLHILWINLVTDSLPALALAAEKGGKNVMNRPPRPVGEHILHNEFSLTVVAGLLNAGMVLILFEYLLENEYGLPLAQTAAMTSTILLQILFAFSTRVRHTVFERSPFGNPWLVAAAAATVLLQVLLLATPLSNFFFVVALPLSIWGMVAASALGAFVLFEAAKWVRNVSSPAVSH